MSFVSVKISLEDNFIPSVPSAEALTFLISTVFPSLSRIISRGL
ncbi:MAG: hypothetical protein Q4F80_05880 [bacterium]|nr:hypothetical protein [bacterium]